MAIDIRAELQSTNDVLIAISSMAEQAIDDTIPNKEAHWAYTVSFLARLALDRISEAEMVLNSKIGQRGENG